MVKHSITDKRDYGLQAHKNVSILSNILIQEVR